MEFKEFSKIARLSREMVISEKIDGTNAQVFIEELEGYSEQDPNCIIQKDGLAMFAGSRNRWITPENDNVGFAKWVKENADDLFLLGEGRHYGEWWGQGIQRKYGQTEKHFSLFNTFKWLEDFDNEKPLCPKCCRVVPVLYRGDFNTIIINSILFDLKEHGSYATPFMDPEGIVVYHSAAGIYFKKTFDNDEKGKS
jgi:RNA ligase.